MRMLTRWASTLLMVCASTIVHAASPEQTASALLDHLQADRTSAAEAMFTPEMAKAVPAAQLRTLWQSLGELRERGTARITTHEGMTIIVVPLTFAKGALDAQIVVDAQQRVAGLMFKPAAAPAAPAPPADAPYRESSFEVPTATGALPGTLAMPTGRGLFPAVVLVHGSGPQDRDETVGPNRPFLDVARGLAAQGIAVLRYDKRTKVRPQDFVGRDFTMDDETTDDAVAAINAMAGAPGIDPGHLYVMGHSQGGMLAPRIAQQSDKVAGLILWSAPARSLLTLLPEQNRYLLGLRGQISAEEQAFLDTLDAQIAAARGTADVPAKDLPLGLPAAYWRAFEEVDPVADARALKQPILLLQGGRDIQVIDTDWQLWKRGLSRQRSVTFRDYPSLNHLGIAGQGPGTLEEYASPGHVLPQLIDDVAHWIKERS
ncbi:alpha/beta fold hydrolase [Stenotrophomonas rhizophila]